MFGARRQRQGSHADRHRQQAEGNIDREQPRPRPQRQNTGGDRRPEGKGGADDHRVIAKAAAEQPAWIDETDQRRIHGHQTAGAEALQHARDQKSGQRPGAGASERGNREQQQAAEINAPVADDLAERAERQQRCDQRDLIGVDHPDHIRRAHFQVGGDRRQRDIGNRSIKRGHPDRDGDRNNRPDPAFGRQAVHRRRRRLCDLDLLQHPPELCSAAKRPHLGWMYYG